MWSYFKFQCVLLLLIHGIYGTGGNVCNLGEKDGSDIKKLPCKPNMVSVEKRLVKMLAQRYEEFGRLGRPVKNTSDTVNVQFGITLIQILDVDEKNQILVTNIWYQYQWKDVLLTWDPADYQGIKEVRISPDQIWLPDILLYNFADERLKEQRDALVVVQNTGSLLWMPQAILKSTCLFDTTYFPFDYQKCEMKFGSWTYNGLLLNIDFLDPNDTRLSLSIYKRSKQWDIQNNTAFRNVFYYKCCPEPYPDITFHLTLKRKVAFYSFILLLPSALLSLLVLVIFYVPPESPAKLQLGMNIFVAFFILLLLLADSTPKSAESIPLIGAYFCLSMLMITMSTVLSAFVANMFFRGVRVNRAPKWLRSCMIDGIARLLCVRDKIVEKDPKISRRNWAARVTGEDKGRYPDADLGFAKVRLLDNGSQLQDRLNNCNDFHESTRIRETVFDSHETTGTLSSRSAMLEEIRAIRDILEKVREKKAKLEEKEKYQREWRVIACVTDKIFFISYVITNAIALLVIFLSNQGNVPPLPLPTYQED